MRVSLAVALLPFVLSACQSTQFSMNNFASLNGVNQPVKKRVENEPATSEEVLFSGNEATSLAYQQPDATLKVESKTTDTATPEKVVRKKKLGPKGRMALRKNKYKNLIAKHARNNGVPLNLALAVVQVESAYRPNARGAAGEIGLMQLMPRTARFIGYKGKMKHLYNPDTNIRYGMKYLGKAHKLGGGSTCGTILKYNAGHGAKKMNRISRKYCKRVRRIMRNG